MKSLENKTVFITGAASGIGLALAKVCGSAGMSVMLSDIDDVALHAATECLRAAGIDCDSVVCDVAQPAAMRHAAEVTIQRFGKVHFLINNAGILVIGGASDNSLDTWRRVMDVNVMGVVHGVDAFLPLIRSHGEGGHILNTASVGGHVAYSAVLAYSTSKHAVVGLTEALAEELRNENIGVSALCPGFTRTQIVSAMTSCSNFASDENQTLEFENAVENGMSPDVVARYAIEQVQQGALYIFTHPRTRDEVSRRSKLIEAAYEKAECSDLLREDPDAYRSLNVAGINVLSQ
ncbi:MAG: SDR family NAD(P)-dependent oxidoreductase [Gammaproteobacteria bacterium]|nr:SDR family NAD(P)-dependent oxidoreductase [Gammaproteobacteria bacterium]